MMRKTRPDPNFPWEHYTYDGAGNQTRAGWLNYSYGADNRMSQSASAYNGTVYGSYVYNGNGERAIRHGLYSGTTYYVYDDQGQLLGEYNVNGISINEYAYGPSGREARLAYWGGIFTYYNDHLGTPQVIANDAQNIMWEADYKPFGEVAAVRRNPNGNAWPFWNNLRFPGQIWDYSSQTNYNYFRNLDPKTGRYTQYDLIGLNGGMNPFGYVGGNPITNYDPTGEFAWGLVFAGVDLAYQLYQNDGNFKCVNWTDVGLSALGGGLLNGLTKGVFKFKAVGSNTWGATRAWMNRRNILNIKLGQQRHHWLFERNQGVGKYVPNVIKNQPWNINPISAKFNNWLGRKSWRAPLGAPSWAGEVVVGSGLAIAGSDGG